MLTSTISSNLVAVYHLQLWVQNVYIPWFHASAHVSISCRQPRQAANCCKCRSHGRAGDIDSNPYLYTESGIISLSNMLPWFKSDAMWRCRECSWYSESQISEYRLMVHMPNPTDGNRLASSRDITCRKSLRMTVSKSFCTS